MYPYTAKNDKVMTDYKLFLWNKDTRIYNLVEQEFGSDWIGFQ